MKHLRLRRVFAPILFLSLMLVIVGCEEDPTEEPPTISAAQRVTTTLQPPLVTQTPLFTATLTPSVSPTPSDIPTETNTPTQTSPPPTATFTPTPTLSGNVSVEGADNKRVREGPGITGFESPISLPGGQEIGVLGFVVNDLGEIWYQISYIDEDNGEIVTGWMRNDLVDVEDPDVIPELVLAEDGVEPATVDDGTAVEEDAEEQTPTATFETPPPFQTAVPEETYTPIPTDDAELDVTALSDLNIRARPGTDPPTCDTSQPVVTENDTISIFWSWFVTEPELMQDHITTVNYEITLNGAVLENWSQFRRPMFQDPEEDNNWTVYWYAPIGQLEAGEYTLGYRATWSAPISDGLAEFGPGTANEEETGQCTFTVAAAE